MRAANDTNLLSHPASGKRLPASPPIPRKGPCRAEPGSGKARPGEKRADRSPVLGHVRDVVMVCAFDLPPGLGAAPRFEQPARVGHGNNAIARCHQGEQRRVDFRCVGQRLEAMSQQSSHRQEPVVAACQLSHAVERRHERHCARAPPRCDVHRDGGPEAASHHDDACQCRWDEPELGIRLHIVYVCSLQPPFTGNCQDSERFLLVDY
jgi:hypothetical protein